MLTQGRLKELFDYDMDSGVLSRKISIHYRANAGDTGCRTRGYLQFSVDGKIYRAHRLIWLYVTGETPNVIDHINGIGADNRWCNLRNVDSFDNSKNCCISKNNISGANGVHWDRKNKKWRASIFVNRACVNLGRYVDIKDAITARKEADIKYNYHKNHGREIADNSAAI